MLRQGIRKAMSFWFACQFCYEELNQTTAFMFWFK